MDRSPHLELAQWHWKRHLAPGDGAIDATAGNGHDTLFLAKLGLSWVYSLDIQAAAIENTRERLKEHLTEDERKRVILCQMPHDDLGKVPCALPPRLIVYNLGYLPGGDKRVTTRTESTLASISSALAVLGEKGALSITCYPGHEEGKREEEALVRFALALPSDEWEVLHHLRLNRPLSPSLLWIARLASSMR